MVSPHREYARSLSLECIYYQPPYTYLVADLLQFYNEFECKNMILYCGYDIIFTAWKHAYGQSGV